MDKWCEYKDNSYHSSLYKHGAAVGCQRLVFLGELCCAHDAHIETFAMVFVLQDIEQVFIAARSDGMFYETLQFRDRVQVNSTFVSSIPFH